MPVACRPAITAPMLVPVTRSTCRPASSSSASTPTWANARAPPPARARPSDRPASRSATGRSAVARSPATMVSCQASVTATHATRCSGVGVAPSSTRSGRRAGAGDGPVCGTASPPFATSTTASAWRRQKSRHAASGPSADDAATSSTRSWSRSARASPSGLTTPGARPGGARAGADRAPRRLRRPPRPRPLRRGRRRRPPTPARAVAGPRHRPRRCAAGEPPGRARSAPPTGRWRARPRAPPGGSRRASCRGERAPRPNDPRRSAAQARPAPGRGRARAPPCRRRAPRAGRCARRTPSRAGRPGGSAPRRPPGRRPGSPAPGGGGPRRAVRRTMTARRGRARPWRPGWREPPSRPAGSAGGRRAAASATSSSSGAEWILPSGAASTATTRNATMDSTQPSCSDATTVAGEGSPMMTTRIAMPRTPPSWRALEATADAVAYRPPGTAASVALPSRGRVAPTPMPLRI